MVLWRAPRRASRQILPGDEGELSANAELHIMKIQLSGPSEDGYRRAARLAVRIAMLRFRIVVMMRKWLA
jgi:hypothetical protein